MALQSYLLNGLAAFLAGAAGTTLILFLGIKLNYKNLRTLYAHIPQDRRFYMAWALTGGAMIAAIVTTIPILEAHGIKDPWTGLIMIAMCFLIFWPILRFLKRLRDEPRQ